MAHQCPNCGQHKYDKDFWQNSGAGCAPFMLGIILCTCGIFLPFLVWIGIPIFAIGFISAPYTLFFQKRTSEVWKCGNCDFEQRHEPS